MSSETRYFIPVCLYPHTKYHTTAGVRALFDKYALRDHDYLIVVADRLLVLDRLVTGRYWTVSSAVNKAKQEAKQILSLIKRMSSRAGAQARGTIVCWDEIAETAQYWDSAQRLQQAVLADQMLAEAIQAFVEAGSGVTPLAHHRNESETTSASICFQKCP